MRLAIISDIHANLEALRATLAHLDGARADRILCLGDLVGYHADPAACIDLLRAAGAVCIAGNHDRAVAGLLGTEGFSATAARGVAWTRARLDAESLRFLRALPLEACIEGEVVAVHGALLPSGGCDMTRLDSVERRRGTAEALARHPSGARICAFGHTHAPGIHAWQDGRERFHREDRVALDDGALHLLNPGSVGQPRHGEGEASCMILDLRARVVERHRIACDMAAALAKARRAGLLPAVLPRSPARVALSWGLRRLGLREALRRALR